ncbi:MAG: NUDIX hydrolase [Proteobacteria bacterium]|nr:NUDIX hydrolase [Pseudomonadota bacterium]
MSAGADENTRRLNDVARDRTSAYVRPRDAATLILVDRGGPVPKVLLGRRHHSHKFMPGKFVFPGGRVEPLDHRVPAIAPLHQCIEQRLMHMTRRPSRNRARAFVLAAIRETCEETGLIIGVRRDVPPATSNASWAAFAEARVHPDLSAVRFIGRAITPPGRPRRFDTRFFAADTATIALRLGGVAGPDAELVELVWLAINEAQRLDMPSITTTMLAELEACIAEGFPHDRPAPFYHWKHHGFVRDIL